MNFKINCQAFEEGFNKVASQTGPGWGDMWQGAKGLYRGWQGATPEAKTQLVNAGKSITSDDVNTVGKAVGTLGVDGIRSGAQLINNLPAGTISKATTALKDPNLVKAIPQVLDYNQQHPGQIPKAVDFLQKNPEAGDWGSKALDFINQRPHLKQVASSFMRGSGRLNALTGLAAAHPLLAGAGAAAGVGLGAWGLHSLFSRRQNPAVNVNVNNMMPPPGQPAGARSNTFAGVENPEMSETKMAADLPGLADNLVSSVVDVDDVPERKLKVTFDARSPKARKMLKNPDYKAYIRSMVENADRKASAVKDNI